MDGERRVPYHLPELLEAFRQGETVLIVEGERKTDLLRHWGFAATCNSGGRGSAAVWAEHAREFFLPCYTSGIIILPDHDDAGREHAGIVAEAFASVGATVRILALPGLPPKGDVLDWVEAGGTAEQLHVLINRDARPWAPSEGITVNRDAFARGGAQHREQRNPAFPIIAWPDIGFDLEEEWRVDEVFPLTGLACLYGGPSTVKTFILLDLLARMARGGYWGGREVKQCPVVYIAAEGSGGIKKRIAGIKKMHAEKGLSPDVP